MPSCLTGSKSTDEGTSSWRATAGKRMQTWNVIKPKFRRSPSGAVAGWGLKVFP